MNTKPMTAKLQIAGTLEWRDKDGNILSTTQLRGAIPLDQLGLTEQQAAELVKESQHGCNDCN